MMFASAGIILVLGILHLVYTYRGPKLTPRDPALRASMTQVSPVITRETTMWKAWIGFNATHSMSLILFGLVYSYFALRRPDVLLASPFLIAVGMATLAAYVVLGKLYFFSIPFLGVTIAFVLYLASLAAAFLSNRAM